MVIALLQLYNAKVFLTQKSPIVFHESLVFFKGKHKKNKVLFKYLHQKRTFYLSTLRTSVY